MEPQMPNKYEIEADKRRDLRRVKLERALSSGIYRELQRYDAILVGLAVKIREDYCTLTLKADIAGTRKVAFVSGDCMITCFIAAHKLAISGALKFRHDKYTDSGV